MRKLPEHITDRFLSLIDSCGLRRLLAGRSRHLNLSKRLNFLNRNQPIPFLYVLQTPKKLVWNGMLRGRRVARIFASGCLAKRRSDERRGASFR